MLIQLTSKFTKSNNERLRVYSGAEIGASDFAFEKGMLGEGTFKSKKPALL